jgi:hypothetical protein
VQEADALRARVEELQSRTSTAGEGSRDAQAATGNSSGQPYGSQAASGGGGQLQEQVAAIVHEAMRFYRLAETTKWRGGYSFAESRARQAAAEIVEWRQAASGGGEPVAWMCEWTDHVGLHHTKSDAEDEANGTVVPQPLYRAPPQPRGWLTEEERTTLTGVVGLLRDLAKVSGRNTADRCELTAVALDAILDRSSPPELVLPLADLGDRLLRDGVIDALAAAGVAVKRTPGPEGDA